MANPRPQLELDDLRRLKWLLGGGLALGALWTVFFLDVEALALVAVASAVIVAALAWPQLPARMPAWVWRGAVPAIIVAAGVDLYYSPDTLPVLIRLAILLVLYRAVSYRRKREDLQLLVLALFLIVVAGVLTVALGFALLLLGFTACALGFLFVVTLIDLVDTGPRVMRPEEMRTVPAWARGGWGRFAGRLRRVVDWRLLGFAGGLFAVVVGLSAGLFLLIPRFEIGSGFFLDRYITRRSRTGFSETVRFGDVTELVRDNSVALRVDLAEGGLPPESPYWRLVVLDEYTPQGFKLSAGLRQALLRTQRVQQLVRHRPEAGAGGVRVPGVWTFYVEPGVSRFLPLPGAFGQLRLRDPAPVQTAPQPRLVALRTEPMAMLAFQLEGIELGATVPDPGLARQLRATPAGSPPAGVYDGRVLLRGPSGGENEAALARMVREITGGAQLGAAEFATRATRWLRARHAYTLSSVIPRGSKDDIVKWLESEQPAFCEYFAGGLAVLCRAAGHPARVVGGFYGGTLNTFERYLMVRNSDAHAWAEVFDGEGRWLRVDPTPGGVAAPGVSEAAAGAAQERDSSWSARVDSLRVLWYRRVVNFDARQQVEMVETVRTLTTDSGKALRAWLEAQGQRLRRWIVRPWDAARLARLSGAGVSVLAVGWLVARGWRAWRWWRPRGGGSDPVRREAGRQLARLRERVGAVGPAARGVVDDLQRLRYGPRATWPEPGAVFRRARRVRRGGDRRAGA